MNTALIWIDNEFMWVSLLKKQTTSHYSTWLSDVDELQYQWCCFQIKLWFKTHLCDFK